MRQHWRPSTTTISHSLARPRGAASARGLATAIGGCMLGGRALSGLEIAHNVASDSLAFLQSAFSAASWSGGVLVGGDFATVASGDGATNAAHFVCSLANDILYDNANGTLAGTSVLVDFATDITL